MNRFIKRRIAMKERILSLIDGLKERLRLIFDDKSKKRRFIAISLTAAILLISLVGCMIYLGDYYRADGEAIEAFAEESVYKYDSKYLLGGDERYTVYAPKKEVYESQNIKAGFIFYPGGKVVVEAYEPLMIELAGRGILCVLVEMPFNLAVFDTNAAAKPIKNLPDVDKWYIGGHSLGGSMAASYLANNTEKIDGLVLLGSYSTADVADSRVLSIYGSEDGVMNREKYDKYKTNLPTDTAELVIDGGNHAYFGMYGEQRGDGEAALTPQDQISITAENIADFINK